MGTVTMKPVSYIHGLKGAVRKKMPRTHAQFAEMAKKAGRRNVSLSTMQEAGVSRDRALNLEIDRLRGLPEYRHHDVHAMAVENISRVYGKQAELKPAQPLNRRKPKS